MSTQSLGDSTIFRAQVRTDDRRGFQYPQPLDNHQTNRPRTKHSRRLSRLEPTKIEDMTRDGRRLDQRGRFKWQFVRHHQGITLGYLQKVRETA